MPVDFFTKKEIPKGKGHMYVKKDGTVYWFASNKKEKNFLKLNRKPAKTKWTNVYHDEKKIKLSSEKSKKKKIKGSAGKSSKNKQ